MSRSICCQGDLLDHGGTVIVVSGTLNIDGRRNARIGDTVLCSKHGVNLIVQGDGSLMDEGVPVVLHGHLCACGCRVMASSKLVVAA
ncbi:MULTISPECIES: PAAR domain-containing protein [unclassified Herbaspirillum]|uniref:PAAR domain-containing protein n=1 Tax=unclassified Herbaspirillum TaxID=2624150 RepID=UPI000E2F1518|nr:MULTISPECIES: PAAR domain-containing protein [unclassified Herbaspirillum]RFB74273.1 PAAR domain-containing protein [Herbaspirillum sp. 3R-3a1]TFI10950.1 PAAR domain-containing protein [Herbaspirillum sp. 3R11]TFI16858.1 PAAR domain-containing protein [Herbaspirillum sp. 3R-11]TFI30504.1 PAAR domain-containing protein [Herbaspirillum sp. 3C11]